MLQKPIHAPFIRLSGNADLAPLLNVLTQVEGSFSKSVKTDTLQWGALPLTVDRNDARSFSVTIPRGLSATYWRMPNLSVGTMYVGEIEFFEEARPRFGQQARAFQQGSFRQYKLKTEAGELQADSSPVSDYWSNTWRLHFAQGSALPPPNSNIELGWEPVEIRSVAQGQAPFRLAFGNTTANPNAMVLDDALLQQTNAETVTVGKAVRVAEAPIVKDHTQLWTVALWGLLGLAVLLLLWMARNLWREMQKEQSTL